MHCGDEQNRTFISDTVIETIQTTNRYFTHLTLNTVLFQMTHSTRKEWKIRNYLIA